eukprot:6202687-Pleurochrysis_carterae.AAC.3
MRLQRLILPFTGARRSGARTYTICSRQLQSYVHTAGIVAFYTQSCDASGQRCGSRVLTRSHRSAETRVREATRAGDGDMH